MLLVLTFSIQEFASNLDGIINNKTLDLKKHKC